MTARLLERYRSEIVPKLRSEFSYQNVHQVPRVEKVVVNMGVGEATQNPKLRENFTGKPEHVVNFMTFIAMEMREIMAECAFLTVNEMVGHVECLDTAEASDHWKAKGVDLTTIFHKPDVGDEVGTYCQKEQDHTG